MTKKDRDILLKVIVEAIRENLTPTLDDFREKASNNTQDLAIIKAKLDRIEHKLDLILTSQDSGKNWLSLKKKVARV